MNIKRTPPCPSSLMDPKILLPRLNARSSLNIHDRSASDTDIATFTERLMDDAAADIHKLDDEVAAIKAENALLKEEKSVLKAENNLLWKEHDITDALISSLVEECAQFQGGLTEIGDAYTFYIPHKDNLELAEMIVEKGQETATDFFPQGRFSYTRLTFDDGTELEDQYVKVKLEHLD